jgi:hypothetical protein
LTLLLFHRADRRLVPHCRSAGIAGDHIYRHDNAFHHDLTCLSFIGLYDAMGSIVPALKRKARSIAYAMVGHVTLSYRQTMERRLPGQSCRLAVNMSVVLA